MKRSNFELDRLTYRNLRELIHTAHNLAERNYDYQRTGFCDWLYVVAFLKEEFDKDDLDVFKSFDYKYPLSLKIFEVEALIYLLNNFKPNPLMNFKGLLLKEVLDYKPNPVIYQSIIEYYDKSVLFKYFKRPYHFLDVYEKEYIKERYYEQFEKKQHHEQFN
jgi:hypothetical protein